MFDKVFKLGLNAGLALLLVIVVFVVIVVAQLQSMAQTPPVLGPTTATLQVVPTLRSVTVSSAVRKFAHCSHGKHPWQSTSTALGFPNGQCLVGNPGKVYPIKIKNGLAANILVLTSNAVPADGGTQWIPCVEGPGTAVACKGPSSSPGTGQFAVTTFSRQLPTGTAITNAPACDYEFHPGSCMAATGQLQREALKLTGPYGPDDNSTQWSVTITWMAVPAQ